MKHECGDMLFSSLNPTYFREGVYKEIHRCPMCRGRYEITFEGTRAGDDLHFRVLDVVAERRPVAPPPLSQAS